MAYHGFLLVYTKNEHDATWQYVISNWDITLHVSDAFYIHPQEHLKTVVTASGVWHETGWSIQ